MPIQSRKIIVKTLSANFRESTEIVSFKVDDPVKDQVLVEVKYLGINASDINFTNGKYLPGVSPPFDSGFEAVGVVLSVGPDVKNLRQGDAVVIMAFGAFAEHHLVPESKLTKIPVARPEALPIVVNGMTASISLEEVGQMKSGETILVTAAAGATGQFAVQLAKLAGNHVIGTCSSANKVEYLRSIGCDRPVNYREESLDKVLSNEYPGGVDVVFECVGGEMLDISVKHIARHGRVIIIGAISGYENGAAWDMNIDKAGGEKRIPKATQLLSKSASIRGFLFGHFSKYHGSHAKKLVSLVQKGLLQSGVDPTEFHELEEVANAIDFMYERKNIGKLVVKVGASRQNSQL